MAHGLAHFLQRRHFRSAVGDFARAQRGGSKIFGRQFRLDALQNFLHVFKTGRIAARVQRFERDRAVKRAGVEMREAELFRNRFRKRALARSGGAVDGDDDGAFRCFFGRGAFVRELFGQHSALPSGCGAMRPE